MLWTRLGSKFDRGAEDPEVGGRPIGLREIDIDGGSADCGVQLMDERPVIAANEITNGPLTNIAIIPDVANSSILERPKGSAAAIVYAKRWNVQTPQERVNGGIGQSGIRRKCFP